jgi:hypothetical protein
VDYVNTDDMIKNLFKSKPKDPVKHLTAKDLEFGFKDNEGRSYYHINVQLGIGMEHWGKANDFTMYMAIGLHPNEIDRLCDLGKHICEEIVRGKDLLSRVTWVFEEIKLQKLLIIHPELLYNFVACFYLREDEPMSEWVESIHNEKVEAFKDCVKTRTSYEFFQLPVLKNLAGISSMSPEEWNKHWNDSIRAIADLNKKIDYLESEIRSAPIKKTSRKVSSL